MLLGLNILTPATKVHAFSVKRLGLNIFYSSQRHDKRIAQSKKLSLALSM